MLLKGLEIHGLELVCSNLELMKEPSTPVATGEVELCFALAVSALREIQGGSH